MVIEALRGADGIQDGFELFEGKRRVQGIRYEEK
jgi:hypothetical protein